MSDGIKPIQAWAVVELMGHVKTAGQVSEETHFGTVLGRLDVPEVGDKPASTFFFGGTSIFRVTPCTEEVARLVLQQSFQAPIVAYQLPRPKFGQAELFEEGQEDPLSLGNETGEGEKEGRSGWEEEDDDDE